MCAIFTYLMISYVMVVTTNIVFGIHRLVHYYKFLTSCVFPSNNIMFTACSQGFKLYCVLIFFGINHIELNNDRQTPRGSCIDTAGPLHC